MTDKADLGALVAEVLAGGTAGWEARQRLEHRLISIADGLPDSVDEALTYLEMDPYYFWSGFSRARMARRLAQASMDTAQRQRARRYVLEVVAGTKHCDVSAVGLLAGAVVDNPMRRALRTSLHSSDSGVAHRALRALTKVRHPGLTEADIETARAIVLADAALTPWLRPSVERLARWLWTPDWEAELRALTKHHDPDRAAAKKVLESVDRRRARRPGP